MDTTFGYQLNDIPTDETSPTKYLFFLLKKSFHIKHILMIHIQSLLGVILNKTKPFIENLKNSLSKKKYNNKLIS